MTKMRRSAAGASISRTQTTPDAATPESTAVVEEFREDVRRRSQESMLLANIAEIAGASQDLEEFFRRAVGRLREFIGYQLVQISLVDMDRKQIRLAYREGDYPLHPIHDSGTWQVGGSLAEVAILTGRAVAELVAEPEESLRRYPLLEWSIKQGFRSILVAPLQVRGRTIGVIHFLTSTRDAYGESHVQLAERFAANIAPAIEHARLYAEARRDAEERAALAEIGRIATSSASVSDVYSQCAAQIRRLVPFDRLSVAMIERERGVARVAYSYSAMDQNDLPPGTVYELSESMSGAVLAGDKGFIVDANDGLSLGTYPTLARLARLGLRSFMTIPMRSGGRVFGVLGAAALAPGAFTDRHLWLAQQVADQIAGPVANAALFALAERRRRESDMLAAVGRIVSSSLDPKAVYRESAHLLHEVIPFDTLAVVTVDSERKTRNIEYWEGVRPPGIDSALTKPLEGTITGIVMKTGHAVLERVADVDDTLGRLPGTTTSIRAGFRAMLCAPLKVADALIGAIHLRSFNPDAYDASHVELIERFAAQIAPAIQNARFHQAITVEKEQRALVAEERARRAALEVERDELLKVTEARRKLLTLVSHELKTPLSATKGFIELVKMNRTGNLNDRQLKQLTAALGSTRHLEMIVSDLLDLSRIDAGTFRLANQVFELGQMIAELATALSPIFEQRGQTLRLTVPDETVRFDGDRDRLGQVISNLLSNSSKFSARGSEVELSSYQDAGFIVIRVTDHGIGVSEEDLGRLFTPFFRADNPETRAVPGTGLGLYIANSIVRLHRGRIRVHSIPGSGSTFTVELPLTSPADR
ncbi:MAG: GAF domain-containing protein [Chloroflexi bacterium]|nr:GAF domain-containing protein [Chloroflexota bacterium]